MPNLAFHLEVLGQAINELVSNGDPRGGIMTKHRTFAALGALGPDLLRYLPVSQKLADDLAQLALHPPASGQTPNVNPTELSELLYKPLGGIYSVVFRQLVIPAWPARAKIYSFLDQMDTIAWAEDTLALLSMVGPAININNEAKSLQGLFANMDGAASVVTGITLLAAPWMESEPPPSMPNDPTANRHFEFLRWHHTGEFALNLLGQAKDPRHRAYAYGYLSHVAASVTGEPFVNNITGGPYRTHWWRNRLAGNFIDSWTYGYFNSNAQLNGDEPSPPYAAWKPLCSANIQNEFDVAGLARPKSNDVPDAVKAVASGDLANLPNQFPDDLAELLLKTVLATYSVQPVPGFSKDTFKQAFVGAFAVYWFMTSGSGPLCNNPLGPPPANCETAPDWITSHAIPTPQLAGLNTGGTYCAALLAIVALLLILSGDLIGGIAALLAAVNEPIVDWDKVRCNLFWLRKTLVDMENLLRDSLVFGGLAYPPPQKLGTIDVNGNTQPALDGTLGIEVPLCRSNKIFGYPRTKDKNNPSIKYADANFSSYPVTPGAEAPLTEHLISSGLYPNFVVNGTGLGSNNSIRQDGPGLVSQQVKSQHAFGDAVSNAVDLIKHDGGGLQNYNLDADRGYGWKTWKYKTTGTPVWTMTNFEVEEEI